MTKAKFERQKEKDSSLNKLFFLFLTLNNEVCLNILKQKNLKHEN